MSGSDSPPQLSVQIAGQTTITSPFLNGLMQNTPLSSDLRSFTGLNGMVVFTLGNSVISDGGQGPFYYNASATANDDGVNIIAPSGQSEGRWLRSTFGGATLPAASGQLLGGSGSPAAAAAVTVGTGLALNSGTLTATGVAASIPAAPGELLGGSGTAGTAAAVSLGSGLVLASGTLTATAGTITIPSATGELLGGSGTAGTAAAVLVGSGLVLNGGTLTATGTSASIPSASGQLLGGSGTAGTAAAVSVGTGLSLSAGTLTVTGTTASIPAAAGELLGGSGTVGTANAVVVGPGLALNSGTLTATGGTTSIPAASGEILGGSGTSGIAAAVVVGPGLVLNSGTLLATGTSATIPAASNQLLGGSGTVGTAVAVAIGNGLALTSGTLASSIIIPSATSALLGGSGTSGTAVAVTVGPGLVLNSGTLSASGGGTAAITGGTIDGTVIGGTTPAAATFTNVTITGTLTGGGLNAIFASPPPIGGTAANSASFTALEANGPVTGSGFSGYLASPPAIGAIAPAAGYFTDVGANTLTITGSGPLVAVPFINAATMNSAPIRVAVGSNAAPATVGVAGIALQGYTTGGVGTDWSSGAPLIATNQLQWGNTTAGGGVRAGFLSTTDALGNPTLPTTANQYFSETLRLHSVVASGANYTNTQALIAVAYTPNSPLYAAHAVTVEAAVDNTSAYSAPVMESLNGQQCSFVFLADLGEPTGTFNPIDAAYSINPYSAGSAKTGYLVPPNTITDTAFGVTDACAWGLRATAVTYGVVGGPNNMSMLRQLNAAGTTYLSLIGINALNDLFIGNDTGLSGVSIGNGTAAVVIASPLQVTGGTINGTTVGATTPAAGAFTTLSSSGTATLSSLLSYQAAFDNTLPANTVLASTSNLAPSSTCATPNSFFRRHFWDNFVWRFSVFKF